MRSARNLALPLACISTLAWFTPPAIAGSYSGPSYSGGVYPDPMMGTDDDYGPVSGGWGADCLTMFNPQDAYCTGTITTTFTWTHESGQTDDSDPPPESVIVTESASAEADAYTTPAGDVSASL